MIEPLHKTLQREQVAIRPEPGNDTGGDIRQIGMLSERFPAVNVRQMNLCKRNARGQESVSQGDTRMGVCGGIDDDPVDPAPSGLNSIDEIRLGVCLEDLFDMDAQPFRSQPRSSLISSSVFEP